MRPPAREKEEVVVKEALNNLGIPILSEFNGGKGFFEGCLLLSKETVFVADTERHTYPFIREFVSNILKEFSEVIYVRVPKARRYMHPDTVFNRIRENLALAYLPAFEESCLFTEDSREKKLILKLSCARKEWKSFLFRTPSKVVWPVHLFL